MILPPNLSFPDLAPKDYPGAEAFLTDTRENEYKNCAEKCRNGCDLKEFLPIRKRGESNNTFIFRNCYDQEVAQFHRKFTETGSEIFI